MQPEIHLAFKYVQVFPAKLPSNTAQMCHSDNKKTLSKFGQIFQATVYPVTSRGGVWPLVPCLGQQNEEYLPVSVSCKVLVPIFFKLLKMKLSFIGIVDWHFVVVTIAMVTLCTSYKV